MLPPKLSLIGITFLVVTISSCSLGELVATNNRATANIVTQNDSIIKSINHLNEATNTTRNTARNIDYNVETPNVGYLSKVNIADFYFGDSIKEEILESKGSWVKVKLSEKITLQSGEVVTKEKTGWFNYNTPDIIYPVSNSFLTSNATETTATGRSLNPADYSQNKFLVTGKTDALDQKSIDILLAEKALNFDGLRFDGKRFDYVNLALGSYRGTYFNNCTLSNVTAERALITPDNDFYKTKIESGVNKDMVFSFWKFTDAIFFNTKLENSNFNNCLFSTNTPGLVTFNTASLKNVKFTNTTDGYLKNINQSNTTYEGCSFKDVKCYGGVNLTSKYIECNFNNCLWQGVAFNNTQVPASRLTGGFYQKFKIVGGEYSKMIIEAYGGVKPQFSEVEIVNAFFNNATIDGWFKDSSQIYGTGDFSGTNFTTSIFENTTFGNSNQVSRFKLKNCNFSNVEFRENVKFIKCDLTGSTGLSSLPASMFIDCIGRN